MLDFFTMFIVNFIIAATIERNRELQHIELS